MGQSAEGPWEKCCPPRPRPGPYLAPVEAAAEYLEQRLALSPSRPPRFSGEAQEGAQDKE